MRGLFVTGTDTGVGKTVLSAALVASMRAGGERVRAHKPVVTGIDSTGCWPPDHELLAAVADMSPEKVAPLRYGPAVSPHLAARLAGERIDPARLVAAATAAATDPDRSERGAERGARVAASGRSREGWTVVVEGVGGLLAPLAEDFAVRDFAAALGLPVLIAARPGLGTINHTLLTLQAARTAGLDVRAVVLTPWPAQPAVLELSNRETIGRLGTVEVCDLTIVESPDPGDLARAGEVLPWRRWLGTPRPAEPQPAEPQAVDPARAAATTAPVTVASSSSSIT